jgi:outer membrane lipoprotein SlyB
MNFYRIVILSLICFLTVGCASSRSGKVYSRDQARQAQSVQLGVVQMVSDVLIEGTKSQAGVLAGGAAGGALGSTVGGGSGQVVATVLGSIAGGIAGAAVEEGVTWKKGLEITVTLDNGQSLVVVQEADELFAVGDRVRVLAGPDRTTRVRH